LRTRLAFLEGLVGGALGLLLTTSTPRARAARPEITPAWLDAQVRELESSLAYKRGWGRVVRPTKRMRARLSALATPLPSPSSRHRGNVLFDGFGLQFAGDLAALEAMRGGLNGWTPEQTADYYVNRADADYVAIKVLHGLQQENATETLLRWHAHARANGRKLVPWLRSIARSDVDAEDEAKRYARICETIGADAILIDAEETYKVDSGGRREIADAMVKALASRFPSSLPRAWTTYGGAPKPHVLGDALNASAGTMNFRAWYTGGYDLLAQNYAALAWYFAVDAGVAHAKRAHWPLDRLHVKAGLSGDTAGSWTGADYAAAMQRNGLRGACAFLGSTASDDDLLALSRALRSGRRHAMPRKAERRWSSDRAMSRPA
jgi:hypothetical protein